MKRSNLRLIHFIISFSLLLIMGMIVGPWLISAKSTIAVLIGGISILASLVYALLSLNCYFESISFEKEKEIE